jgi:hypothetical protein
MSGLELMGRARNTDDDEDLAPSESLPRVG